MTDDIPTLPPPEQMPPVQSLADLDHTWRALMGPLGFYAPQLWALLLDDCGRLLPGIIKVEECPDVPEADLIANLFDSLRMVMDLESPGGSVALLWAHPGDGGLQPHDLAWARTITDCASRSPLQTWPVHVANDRALRLVTPDDLAA